MYRVAQGWIIHFFDHVAVVAAESLGLAVGLKKFIFDESDSWICAGLGLVLVN